MKAIIHDTYGGTEVLSYGDVEPPPIGTGEVMVRIRAVGINRGDVLAIAGIPYAARLSYGLTGPKNRVPGTDAAGEVVAVGDGVRGLSVGDAVFGWVKGALAGYAVAAEGDLVPKPGLSTFEQTAAVPTAAVTAMQALKGSVGKGSSVLVLGASGGVGGFAVQIAKALGAEVTGVASTRNLDLLRSIGADHVVDYRTDDITASSARFDVIVDMVGTHSLLALRRLLTPTGTLIVVGGQNPRSLTGMGRFVRAMALSPFVRQTIKPLFGRPDTDDLRSVARLLESGQILPVIDSVHDLAGAIEALRYVGEGHVRGKVVVTA